MKKVGYRTIIQYLIITTSFTPFTYIYRKIYDLSTKIATLLIQRVDGVVTIYLRRGVAQGEITYGLSDIDLLVIVEDEKENPAKLEVRAVYNRLSHFIPLFGSGDRELGVYSAAEFMNLFNDYGFYRYRFNEGKYTWRLLFGKDVVKTLPELEDYELSLPATEELKAWWALLVRELSPASDYQRFQRKYLWYKAIAEAAKIYLFVCQGKKIRGREDALHEIEHYMPAEYHERIETVQRYADNLNGREELELPSLFSLFVFLVSRAYEKVGSAVLAGKTGKKAMVYLPDTAELSGGTSLYNRLAEFLRDFKEELAPHCNGMAVIPQLEFDNDVLNNSDIDSLYLVLFQRDMVPFETLIKIHFYFGQWRYPQNIEPFIMFHNDIAFSLGAGRPYTCIKTIWTTPEFFQLSRACAVPLHEDFLKRTVVSSVTCSLPPRLLEETILTRASKIDSMLLDKTIYRAKTLELLRFFWASTRTKLLALSLKSEEVDIPLTSSQVLEKLQKLFPGDADWLETVHKEYNKEISGKENEVFRYTARALEFMRHI